LTEGRFQATTLTAGALDIVTRFDSAGRLDLFQDHAPDGSRVDTAYDDANGIDQVSQFNANGQLERRNVYDGAGQLDSSTDYGPDGAPDVERSHDSADRADVVTTYDVSNHLDTVQYLDDNLQLTHFQDYAPDGSYHETRFTGAGLIEYQASFDSSARLDLINWHDATGQFYQQERYDDLERLDYIQTREGGGWSYWTYDDNEQPDYVESFDERGVVTFRAISTIRAGTTPRSGKTTTAARMRNIHSMISIA
jgi:hypothetical protein